MNGDDKDYSNCRDFGEVNKCFATLKNECNEDYLLRFKKRMLPNVEAVIEHICDTQVQGNIYIKYKHF